MAEMRRAALTSLGYKVADYLPAAVMTKWSSWLRGNINRMTVDAMAKLAGINSTTIKFDLDRWAITCTVDTSRCEHCRKIVFDGTPHLCGPAKTRKTWAKKEQDDAEPPNLRAVGRAVRCFQGGRECRHYEKGLFSDFPCLQGSTIACSAYMPPVLQSTYRAINCEGGSGYDTGAQRGSSGVGEVHQS